MTKRQKSLSNKKNKNVQKKTIGRPMNKKIQKQFMQAINEGKIDCMDAQSQLELCFMERFSSLFPQFYQKSSALDQEIQDPQYSVISIDIIMSILKQELSEQDKIDLYKKFAQIRKQWKFKEFDYNKPMPKYFFNSQNDLTFILYYLMKKLKVTMTASKLIFIQLLLLRAQGYLKARIFTIYAKNMKFFEQFVIQALQKVTQKIQTEKNKLPRQTRIIKKARKNNNKKTEETEQYEVLQEIVQESSALSQEIIMKTVNHIAWSYWYIVSKF